MERNKPGNHLLNARSPYLLQHAYNPVNWYPWGDEALTRAKREDKPMIVSIGYSACHWCHVMERESFENKEIASIMNEHYICIKVDREERPDIDQIYMEAIQSMGLQGGWPLNVFVTPDQKPFYGGTYFPPLHWRQILRQIASAYKQNRQQIEESANSFLKAISMTDTEKYGLGDAGHPIDDRLFDGMVAAATGHFDAVHGGMGKAPKFPMPSNWNFLMAASRWRPSEEIERQLQLTLDKMALGGIYDHLGGGFARYSVDERWFAPHFEKMLYDNAQLIGLYAQAYQVFGKKLYRDIVYETVLFLEREMLSEEGGFFTALDADSEGEEGRFYTWTAAEVRRLAGADADIFCDVFDVREEGNWERGLNILHRPVPLDQVALQHKLDTPDVMDTLGKVKMKLMKARDERVRPGLDDKILAGWNALAICGLVDAYHAFGEPQFLELAQRNARFILDRMFINGTLFRNYKDGQAGTAGTLEDYAFLIRAALALYQADFNTYWYHTAEKLTGLVMDSFYDPAEELFFYTDKTEAPLIARKKEIFDNVIPSSNSMMAINLGILGALTHREDYQNMALQMTGKVASLMQQDVRHLSNWALASLLCQESIAQVAIMGTEYRALGDALQLHYLPGIVIAAAEVSNEVPMLKNRMAVNGRSTIYVCFNKTCKLPVHSVDEALKQILDKNSTKYG